jgi:hypothetical protein
MKLVQTIISKIREFVNLFETLHGRPHFAKHSISDDELV